LDIKELESEHACLGSCLLDKNCFILTMESLLPNDFYNNNNKEIFTIMLKMFKKDLAIDLVTLTSECGKTDKLINLGGVTYLTNLINSVPTIQNIEHYISLIKKASAKRKQKQLLSEVVAGNKTIEQAMTELEELGDSQIKEETFQKILESTLTDTLKGTEHQFSIDALNKYLGGFDKGELLTIGGFTSQGKSDLAIQLAIDFCIKQKRVLFLSTEMLAQEIGRRLLGNLGNVRVMDLRKGLISSTERTLLEDISKKIGKSWNFNIKKIYEIDDVGKYVRKYEPEILVLDYIQNLSGEDYKMATRNIKYLQSITMSKEISTICVSQLNRGEKEIREPRLSDLRDTGRIEEVSNMVLFLYWKERLQLKNNSRVGGEPPEEVELLISKNRDGTIGRTKLHFYPEFARFEDPLGREYQQYMDWEEK